MTILAQTKIENKYDISQSPLYKLSSKKVLASYLNLPSTSDLNRIIRLDDPYRKFPIMTKGKPRQVEVPSRDLLPVHNRLFTLLKRIQLPDYLHSGTKGRSYLTNAKAHLGAKEVYTLDIKKFYPSVTRAKVAAFFRNYMGCERDIAAILADISTCEGHLPTGSALSQVLAYLTCKEMFDMIYAVSHEANLKMTCYVDDVTFSGDKISKRWIHDSVKPIIKKSGMNSHKDKYFALGSVKEITGVIVDGDSVKVCNRMHKSIYDLSIQISEAQDKHQLDELYKKLIGKLSAAGQIVERFKAQRQSVVKARRKFQGQHT